MRIQSGVLEKPVFYCLRSPKTQLVVVGLTSKGIGVTLDTKDCLSISLDQCTKF